MLGQFGNRIAALFRSGPVAERSGITRRIEKYNGKRSIQAGVTDRTTADWKPVRTTADPDIFGAFADVRARSRDLAMNNEVARKAVRLVRKNVPGAYGFMLKMKIRAKDNPKLYDRETGRLIRDKFLDWCKAGNCEVTGKMNFRKVQHVASTQKFVDGEILIKKVYDQSKYGFRLQLLDPDCLDETANSKTGRGTTVRMGVELNDYRMPVAYYLKKEQILSGLLTNAQPVPASQIYHVFDTDRAFQTRGISELVSAMVKLRHIGATDNAAITATRAAASQTGVISDKNPDEPLEDDGTTDETTTDEEGEEQEILNLQPLQVLDIGNKTFEAFNPTFPSAVYDPIMKSFGRRAASGLDINYHELFSDFADVNLSSIRWSIFDNRETWMLMQEDMIEQFLEPVFRDWLESAINVGAIDIPGVDLVAEFDRINCPYFIGRRWPYMDPDTEVTGKLKELDSCITSLIRVHAEHGDDTEEIFDEIAEVNTLAKEKGIVINFKTSGAKTLDPPAPVAAPIPTNGKSVPTNGVGHA